ncbi:MAG: 4-(cytidine 5'-diphospho)-2-C-methyl-D-erythritol kinase [Bacteroidales bacterium]|nr:4-(cytidine 5'-diphospho)-2-C-methyl-D-erythritol kinase [Bacteroidales bacterium]
MICFPNAKINIGLNILEKRDDGFHNIETVFYPIGLCDILEFIPIDKKSKHKYYFENTGIYANIIPENDLVIKTYNLLVKEKYHLPAIKIHLHKVIPLGAGLGGGSSNASFMLKYLNEYFRLNISEQKLKSYASKLGSDCSFFIDNIPCFASGRGDILKQIELNLSGYYIVLIKPDFSIETTWAYSQVKPKVPDTSLLELIKSPVTEWSNLLINNFEKVIVNKHPEIAIIKEKLYKSGAVYASMSGSGSAVYGIFSKKPDLKKLFNEHYFYWESKL